MGMFLTTSNSLFSISNSDYNQTHKAFPGLIESNSQVTKLSQNRVLFMFRFKNYPHEMPWLLYLWRSRGKKTFAKLLHLLQHMANEWNMHDILTLRSVDAVVDPGV